MFSQAYKRYVLGALTAVYTWNLVDRGLMSLLLESIREDLSLSDTQLGFLTGIAFGLFYAVLGLPVARLADRGNRVTITSVAIGLWGLTVMACLPVTNYVQLVFARMAAAVGESGCKPPTYSLVGDYFPAPAERTGAMAVYLTASSIATLIAFIVGGWLNELYGWRLTFFLMGIPGVVLAIVVRLSVAEPRQRVVRRTAPPRAYPLKKVISTLWRQRSFRHLTIALVLLYMMGLGLNPWYAAFLIRSHGLSTHELGIWLGVILSLASLTGTLLGGVVARRWLASNEQGQMHLCAASVAFVLPCFVAFLTLPGKYQALVSLAPLMVSLCVFMGPIYALMQRLVVDEIRATMMALVMLLSNLVGMGIGPQLVGILSDLLAPTFGIHSLRYAMLLVSFISLWAAYHFWLVAKSVKQDLAAVNASLLGRGEDNAMHSLRPASRS